MDQNLWDDMANDYAESVENSQAPNIDIMFENRKI